MTYHEGQRVQEIEPEARAEDGLPHRVIFGEFAHAREGGPKLFLVKQPGEEEAVAGYPHQREHARARRP